MKISFIDEPHLRSQFKTHLNKPNMVKIENSSALMFVWKLRNIFDPADIHKLNDHIRLFFQNEFDIHPFAPNFEVEIVHRVMQKLSPQ